MFSRVSRKKRKNSKKGETDIVSMSRPDVDGHIYNGHRDPPGQSTIYIPSGDTWRENYRLSTFVQFPQHAPVIPAHLAANGFYWTGYKDRVKCFSCGLCVENWVQGDDVRDKKWHRNDCDFISGRDTSNVPLNGFFSKLRIHNTSMTSSPPHHNLTNGVRDPHHGPTTSSSSSSREETRDRSLNMGSTSYRNSNGSMEIPAHQTSSASMNPNNNQISSTSTANSTPQNNTGSEETERSEFFPCLSPVNPHMSSAINRLESFKARNGIRWPKEQLRATIEQLVNAGFYYLGERDRVKCWYCNGGLQNWDYEDEPWTEHAKWFPTCEYLLRAKGPAFVESIISAFPNLNRPLPSTVPSPQAPVASTGGASLSPSRGGDIGPVDQAVEIGMGLEYVKRACEMGFDKGMIKEVLKRKYATNGKFYSTSEEFMDALFSYESRQRNPESPPSSSASSVPNLSPPGSQNSQNELRKLEESRLCKICRKNSSNVVLIPCGHLASCENCHRGLKKCPVCARGVQDVIKTFRA